MAPGPALSRRTARGRSGCPDRSAATSARRARRSPSTKFAAAVPGNFQTRGSLDLRRVSSVRLLLAWAEESGTDSNLSGAFLDGLQVIVAHAHGQHAEVYYRERCGQGLF